MESPLFYSCRKKCVFLSWCLYILSHYSLLTKHTHTHFVSFLLNNLQQIFFSLRISPPLACNAHSLFPNYLKLSFSVVLQCCHLHKLTQMALTKPALSPLKSSCSKSLHSVPWHMHAVCGGCGCGGGQGCTCACCSHWSQSFLKSRQENSLNIQ